MEQKVGYLPSYMTSDIVGLGLLFRDLSDHPDEDDEFESVGGDDDLDGDTGDDTEDEDDEEGEEF